MGTLLTQGRELWVQGLGSRVWFQGWDPGVGVCERCPVVKVQGLGLRAEARVGPPPVGLTPESHQGSHDAFEAYGNSATHATKFRFLILGLAVSSFRALSGRLELPVRPHKFDTCSLAA